MTERMLRKQNFLAQLQRRATLGYTHENVMHILFVLVCCKYIPTLTVAVLRKTHTTASLYVKTSADSQPELDSGTAYPGIGQSIN